MPVEQHSKRLRCHQTWGFPEIGVPPNHPFVDGIFHELNHPFWGTPMDGNSQMDIPHQLRFRLGKLYPRGCWLGIGAAQPRPAGCRWRRSQVDGRCYQARRIAIAGVQTGKVRDLGLLKRHVLYTFLRIFFRNFGDFLCFDHPFNHSDVVVFFQSLPSRRTILWLRGSMSETTRTASGFSPGSGDQEIFVDQEQLTAIRWLVQTHEVLDFQEPGHFG